MRIRRPPFSTAARSRYQSPRYGQYCEPERAEEIIGRWLGPHREHVLLASKVRPCSDGDAGSRRHIRLAVEKTLKRLGTDWLDILYLDPGDDNVDLLESLEAVTTLVEQTRVLYLGLANFPAWQAMKAVTLAAARDLARPVCVKPPYNLVKRLAEIELFPMARSEQLAVCATTRWPPGCSLERTAPARPNAAPTRSGSSWSTPRPQDIRPHFSRWLGSRATPP